MNVLFIGATGLVGSHVTPLLAKNFDMTLMAIADGEVEGMKVTALDITDWDAIEAAFAAGNAKGERFDAVVNCAIANYRDRDWRNPDGQRQYFEQCIEVNARGAYHVYEAAARARIPRVVFISSMTAVLGLPKYEFIDSQTRDRPNDVYAACKVFGENVGRSYVFPRKHWRTTSPACKDDDYSMNVICLRLGQPISVPEDYDEKRLQRIYESGVALDMRDLALAIECALRTDVEYGVYSIVSASEKLFVDPALYAELGYTPRWKFTPEGVVPMEEAKIPALAQS